MPASERGAPLAGRTDARPTCPACAEPIERERYVPYACPRCGWIEGQQMGARCNDILDHANGWWQCDKDVGHAGAHSLTDGAGTVTWQPPAPPSGADATPAPRLQCDGCRRLFAPHDLTSVPPHQLCATCPEPSAPAALPPIPEGHPHADVLAWMGNEQAKALREADQQRYYAGRAIGTVQRAAHTSAAANATLRANAFADGHAALLALPGDARPEGDALGTLASVIDYKGARPEVDR